MLKVLRSALLMFVILPVLTLAQQLPQFQVQASTINGLNPNQNEKMRLALSVFEKVMNDRLFQTELLSLTFHSDMDDDPHKNLTTSQIVEKIYAANEWYNSQADNKADVHWLIRKGKRKRFLFFGNSALGYGNEGDRKVYTYSWFLEDGSLAEVAGHVAHEWTHKLNFVHQFGDHDRRDETVPYAFGDLVEKHSTKYVK